MRLPFKHWYSFMQIYFLEVSYTYAKAKQDGVNVHMAGYLTFVSGEIRRDSYK